MRRRGVLAALVAGTGSVVSAPVGTVVGGAESLSVSIYQTSSPVTGGEWLDVFVSVGNGATHEVTDTLRLYDSSGNLLDSREVTMPRESTEIVGMGYRTYETRSDVTFPITVASGGDSDTEEVTVEAIDEDASLGVNVVRTSSPVDAGERLEVLVSVGNDAPHSVTDTLTLYDSSGNALDGREVTLPRESTQYVQLGYETYPVRNTVSFRITVESSGDSDGEEVTVYGTG